MHILEIPSFFIPHGGLFALDQAKALAQRGNEVRMLVCVQIALTIDRSFYMKAPIGRWWEEMEGIEMYRTYMRGIPKVIKPNQERWCRTVLSMYEDYKKRYGKPDVIHAHCCQWAGVAASMISRKEGIPFVITEHLSSTIFERNYGKGWIKAKWAMQLLRSTYEKANCTIPVSEELVDDIAPFFGKNYNYHSVSNMIDTDFFIPKKRNSKKGRPFKFCCLAVNFIHIKGLDVLGKAFQDMNDCELHLAGRGTEGDDVKELFCEANNVIFHGELSKQEVLELLYECDALILASRSEAQGLVVLEAVSTGIPAVVTDAIPKNALVDGACYIAKTGDVESLKEQMKAAMLSEPNMEWHDYLVKTISPQVIGEKIEKVLAAQISSNNK